MGAIKRSTVQEKNKKGDCVRNICIMAHVDHGKTTLADALIATNGIISEKQAGSVRYMDSRKDEMERGITMKSSCITLAYPHANKNFLINLVDSPGHVDFSSEVSTAVRLCDGCILVVDVIEGLCAQTKAVMRQAWAAGAKTVLVVNKIDRLIMEKEMDPIDAYYHIASVLEQVNAYMAELYNVDVLGRTNLKDEEVKKTAGAPQSPTNEVPSSLRKNISHYSIEDVDDSDLYFNPIADNVVFASAVDGWGFRISHFAEQFSKKLGMSLKALIQTLWGDYYISVKKGEKRILKGARDRRKNPLFVSLILDNLYNVYRKTRPATADIEDVEKIADSLGIKVPARLYQSNSESKARFQHICSHWLPLSKAVLEMVVIKLPAPTQLNEEKARKLLTTATQDFMGLPQQTKDLVPHITNCSSDESAPLIVYVSQMFGVSSKKLREAEFKLDGALSQSEAKEKRTSVPFQPKSFPVNEIDSLSEEPEEEAEELLAFARVFSGTLKPGQEVYVLGPKHSPNAVVPFLSQDGEISKENLKHCPYVSKCKISRVYLLLGREVQCLKAAGAGLMIGVSGLTGHIIKSGSLSSSPLCPPFTHVINSSALSQMQVMASTDGPMLRVQVLPKNPRCLGSLREGLKLLNQADPCVQVWLDSSGAYMVGAAGEVHLQRCLSDLEERYARTGVVASDPIVPFRETVVPPPSVDNVNEAIEGENMDSREQQERGGSVEQDLGMGFIRVKALPLPPAVTELLCKHSDLLRATLVCTSYKDSSTSLDGVSAESQEISEIKQPETVISKQNVNDLIGMSGMHSGPTVQKLTKENKLALSELKNSLEKVFREAGPEWEGAVDQMWSLGPHQCGPNVLFNRVSSYMRPSLWDINASLPEDCPQSFMDHSLTTGFQLCCSAGTLCEEPLMGVGFVVEEWSPTKEESASLAPGRVIALAKDLFLNAFDSQPRRMMVSMYSCVVTVTSEAVGNVYTVLGRRHGRVLHGDITEGSTSWNVTALLPIVESMDFANELRKATSGEAQPQLLFSHWETLDIDPFWEPSTVEELKQFGEKADSENLALHYMNYVRKRKGKKEHNKKLIGDGSKQRTLTKNK